MVVNLISGPGTGKSTLCAMIFSELKKRHIDCEMALEYAKDVVWEEGFLKLSNQIYIFGKQHSRLYRLNGKVDIIITDSPLIASIIYDKTENIYLKDLVLTEFKNMNNLNFYISRQFDYQQNGRYQNEEEARLIDIKYKNLLDDNGIDYIPVVPFSENLSSIIEKILEKF